MGVEIQPGMLAGEVRNACLVAAATWRIDSRLPEYCDHEGAKMISLVAWIASGILGLLFRPAWCSSS